jgi:hypothetical protein
MKIALWIAFALIAALWTGTVLVSAELTSWLAPPWPLAKRATSSPTQANGRCRLG